MKDSIDKKLQVGRPYGGTGFVFNKKYAKCVKPLLNYSHERVTVLELKTESGKILIINAYFPLWFTELGCFPRLIGIKIN